MVSLNIPSTPRDASTSPPNSGRIWATALSSPRASVSLEEWERWEKKLSALPDSKSRQLKRFFFASATDVEPDKQGRIVLPAVLREYAGLTKDVVVIGASDRAEIWDAARWAADNEDLTSDQMAELMDSLNF